MLDFYRDFNDCPGFCLSDEYVVFGQGGAKLATGAPAGGRPSPTFRHCNVQLFLLSTGWPKSPDTNVRAYCYFVESFVILIFYAKHYNHQPFEDFTKIKQKWVHFSFIFVHFKLFGHFW